MEKCTLKFCDSHFANLIFLPVLINDKEIIALFDTGAQKSFIAESIVQQLRLERSTILI